MPEEGAVQGGVRLSVDGWRRHVLISWCAKTAQPWLSSSSTLCQTGCCQGLCVNESRQPGKEYKQARPWMTETVFSLYTPSLMIYFLFCIMSFLG